MKTGKEEGFPEEYSDFLYCIMGQIRRKVIVGNPTLTFLKDQLPVLWLFPKYNK